MVETLNLAKGQKAPLVITEKARRRVICGLNWDPRMESAGMLERLKTLKGHQVDTYDLDLMAIMYDADGAFVDGVNGDPDQLMDQSGHIYHSGDDTAGIGEDDDERVSIELLDMPDYIHHIFFIAEVQSAHTFGEVNHPSIRIADSYTNNDILHVTMNQGAGKDSTAFVFARIYRHPDHGWALHYIGDHMDGEDIADWTETLKKYLS